MLLPRVGVSHQSLPPFAKAADALSNGTSIHPYHLKQAVEGVSPVASVYCQVMFRYVLQLVDAEDELDLASVDSYCVSILSEQALSRLLSSFVIYVNDEVGFDSRAES